MTNDKVLQYAKEHGFDSVKHRGKWNGFDIYKPDKNEDYWIGDPVVIMVQGGKIRFSSPNESFQIYHDMNA